MKYEILKNGQQIAVVNLKKPENLSFAEMTYIFNKAGIEGSLEERQVSNIKFTAKFKKDDGTYDTYEVSVIRGFRVSVGRSVSGVFGGRYPAYVKNLTKRHIYSNREGRIFCTVKSVENLIRKNETGMRYLSENNGYRFSVEGIGHADKSDVEYLKQIIDETLYKFPEFKTMNGDAEADICRRMLGLEEGRLCVSENGYFGEVRVLSECDENAQEAIKIVRNANLIPYHVIRKNILNMDMYAVLYSSNIESNRPTREGDKQYLYAYVYNADHPELSEYGEIGVETEGKGLLRVA